MCNIAAFNTPFCSDHALKNRSLLNDKIRRHKISSKFELIDLVFVPANYLKFTTLIAKPSLKDTVLSLSV